jgi:hypothetical protein
VTALCPGGGASQPRPGIDLLQSLTAAGIIDLLVTGSVSWYAYIAAGVGYLAYNLTDLCATDPPPMPTLSAERLFSYVNEGEPQNSQALREDVYALLANYLWRQYCECVGGGTVAPFLPPPQPDGYQSNDPQLDRPAGTPCSTAPTVFETKNFNAVGDIEWDFNPSSSYVANAQWLRFTHNGGYGSTPFVYPATHTLIFRPAGSTTVLGQYTWQQTAEIAGGSPETHQLIVPAGASTMRLLTHVDGISSRSFGMQWIPSWFCSAPPPSLLTPCCPPDPALENLIIQVLRLEQLILDSLGGTFGYTKGAVHANLTGSGSLPVTGLRGVLVDVTQGTPTNPQLEGVPPYEWNLGWISLLTGDGFVDEKRLTRQHQVWQPALMPGATTVGYFLHPGVTATLTELHPPS